MPASASTAQVAIQTIEITKEQTIDAPIEITWQAVLEQLGPESQMPDGTPFPFKLEAWPGGRWFRDLGNDTGHLWAHVQVIKPPKLLEMWGPMMMSFPAVNHLQYRLTAEGKSTRFQLTHRGIGTIPSDFADGMREGFDFWVKRVKKLAEGKKDAGSSRR
jgi:uncharacterized protein YndB with AHSA1/START domain